MAGADTNVQVTLRGRYSASLDRAIGMAERGMDRLGELTMRVNGVLKWTALVAGAAAVAVAKVGVSFNSTLENASISFAAMLTQLAPDRFRTLDAGLEGSRKIIEELRMEALLTVATFEDLVEATQGLIGPALAAGVPVEQIPQLVAMISRTVSTVMPGAPGYQIMQEGAALLGVGRIDASTRVAKNLGITGEAINEAIRSGRIVEFLTEKMGKFNEASELSAKTLTGLWSNLQDAFKNQTAATTTVLFEELKDLVVLLQDLVGSDDFRRSLTVMQGAATGLIDKGGVAGRLLMSGAVNLPKFWFENVFMPDEGLPALAKVAREVFWHGVAGEASQPSARDEAQPQSAADLIKQAASEAEDYWSRQMSMRMARLGSVIDANLPQSSMARFGLFAGRGEQFLQQQMHVILKNQLGELRKINRKLEQGIKFEEPTV